MKAEFICFMCGRLLKIDMGNRRLYRDESERHSILQERRWRCWEWESTTSYTLFVCDECQRATPYVFTQNKRPGTADVPKGGHWND